MTPTTTPVAKPVISREADILDLAPVIPVVVVDSVEQAVPLARALLRGGIPVIELTLRSAAGLGAIEAVASEVEGMVVGAGTVVTFEVEGGKPAAFALMNALRLVDISNNLGDAKSLSTHPATTTHRRLSPEDRAAVGITDGTVRVSVGLEDVADLLADLDAALDAAAAVRG